MHIVLVYSETLSLLLIGEAAVGMELRTVSGRRELVSEVMELPEIHSVLIQKAAMDPDYRLFLRCLKRNFPFLRVAVIAAAEDAAEGHHFIRDDVDEVALREEMRRFLSRKPSPNRREHHRFGWPLKALLSLDGRLWVEYPLCSISSGGAFLECASSFPPPGVRASLKILFQNFSMLAGCEILDARRTSSNLPVGFGVRFVDLSQNAVEKIDRIVDDALVRVLMDPGLEPEIPSLDDFDISGEGFESL